MSLGPQIALSEKPSRGLLIAVFLLGIYATALLWVTAGFLTRIEAVSHWSFAFAIITNACLLPIYARWLATPMRRIVSAFSLALLIYAVSLFLAALFYDISFDGQTYHAQAILAIDAGWNPVYDTLPVEQPNTMWVQHYGKGYEYVAYSIYALTRNLESGKGLNSVLIAASALVLHHAAAPHLQLLRLRHRRALTALVVFNPIAVFTLFTFYVDGQIASCLLVLLASAEITRRDARAGSLLVFAGLLILAQLKFTALVYGVIAVAGIGAFLFAYSRQRLFSYALVCVLAAAVAVGWVGYNPYVRNFLEKGHPFFPLMGKGSISIMGGANSPPSFEHKNSVAKLAEASFARSRNVHGAAIAPEPEPKIPFTFKVKEWTVFKSHDVRIGGFGPLWSGVLVLSAAAFVLAVVALRRKRAVLSLFVSGSALLLAMTLINPECWYARYVPQLWWLPLWIAAFVLRYGGQLARLIGTGILLTMSINLAGISAVSIASDTVLTAELRHQFAWLLRQPQPVRTPPHVFVANTARMKELGIVEQPIINAADTVQLAPSYHTLTLQNSQTKVFYDGAPYQPSLLFARLAHYITPANSHEQH